MISVCIPSRGPAIGLWATIIAAHKELDDMPHEFIVHLNGQPYSEPHQLIEQHAQGLITFLRSDEPTPPPIARNECAKLAQGDWLCFFDDHVIPDAGFFRKAFRLFAGDADVVHSSYTTHIGYHKYYHFIPGDGDNPLKGDYSRTPLHPQCPYICKSGPHGGFLVRREVFTRAGGYDDFWQGFGGEEAYFDMKIAKLGYKVYMHPQMMFYHFSCRAETRGYDKTFNEWNFEEGWRRLAQL